MKIRNIVFFIIAGCLISFSSSTFAQMRKVENMPTYDFAKYHFGFILAVNQMHFTIKPVEGLNKKLFYDFNGTGFNADSAKIYSIEDVPSTGFTVGIVGNLRLGTYLDLRLIPSLSFGERNLEYTIWKFKDGVESPVYISKNVQSTFIELPLHIKYKSQRLNNFRAYLIGGANLRIDLASQANKKKEASEIQIKLLRNDIYGELGVGFDFYFEWFKFGTELKMSYGMFDMLKHENNLYTDGIEQLRSKLFQLSFTFE